jgi:voltage-dependent potassium channel beta subunit
MSGLNSKKTAMRYNNLGASGLLVSELSFGCMTFTEGDGFLGKHGNVRAESAYEMMKSAYEHGINFFDNAEAYGGAGVSEKIMGAAIKMGIERGTWERADLVISTKIFFGGRGANDNTNSIGLSRKHLYEGTKASLARMGLEYVDLLFCHRPDPRTPIEETVRGMNNLIDRGFTFYWGTSEWSSQQLQEAKAVATSLGLVPPLMDQCQYSMIERTRVENEYAPLYPALGLTVWSPLAGGVLTGKYNKGVDTVDGRISGLGERRISGLGHRPWRMEKSLPVAQAIEPIAKDLGCTMAQLAIAWCAANPNVSTVILGATKLSQLEGQLLVHNSIDYYVRLMRIFVLFSHVCKTHWVQLMSSLSL